VSKKFNLLKAFENYDFDSILGTVKDIGELASGFIKKGAKGIATVKEENPINYLDYSVDAPRLRLPPTNAPLQNQPVLRFNDPRLATALRNYVQNSTNKDFRELMMRYSNVQPTIKSRRKTIPVARPAVNVRKSTKTLPTTTTTKV
jgi:hypothetical protein